MSSNSARWKPPQTLLRAWLGLLVLLGGTVALAYAPLAWGNTVIALFIAAVKAFIVAIIFMELKDRKTLARIFAGAGLLWLATLFWLALTDYATRANFPPPASLLRTGATSGRMDHIAQIHVRGADPGRGKEYPSNGRPRIFDEG